MATFRLDSTKKARAFGKKSWMNNKITPSRDSVSFKRPKDGNVLRKSVKRTNQSKYKHIPHSEKPPHLVARRNARERRRVQAVNSAFVRLRRHVPYESKHKRLSKVKTLRFAIDYIKRLSEMIQNHDRKYGAPCCNFRQQIAMETDPECRNGNHHFSCGNSLKTQPSTYASWSQQYRLRDAT